MAKDEREDNTFQFMMFQCYMNLLADKTSGLSQLPKWGLGRREREEYWD